MKQQKCNYFPSLWWRGREKGLSTFLFLLLFSISLHAQRQDILLNNNWNFRFSHQVQGDTRRVDLPHTWNAQDALAGKIDYKRGIGNYEKALYIRPEWKGKRLFLRFDGVNSIADVFINRKHIGEHRGGYGAFIFEITDLVKYGEKNSVLVRANNGEQLDIMPLVGDFNFYGGIYRDVHLLITDETCISPLDYASPGVYLVQEVVSPQEAKVCAKVNLSNRAADGTAELQVLVTDGTKVICKESRNVSLKQGADIQEQLPLLIQKPRLWNGCEDPFMYQVSISLHKDGKQIDSVTQPLGLRYYHTDPDKGFFLNGKHLPLHGVCRHQDRAEVGNALRPQHHEEDVALMREMGVNAIRERFREDDFVRFHPIINSGGDLVNVIPDYVTMESYTRAANVDALLRYNTDINRALRAGADAVGATCELQDLPGYLPLRPDENLRNVLRDNAVALFGEEHVAVGAHNAGSTEMGDVSHLIPVVHPWVGCAKGVLHGANFVLDNEEVAYEKSPEVLAMTIIDLLYDDAKKAEEICANFKPVFTKETYCEFQDKIASGQ